MLPSKDCIKKKNVILTKIPLNISIPKERTSSSPCWLYNSDNKYFGTSHNAQIASLQSTGENPLVPDMFLSPSTCFRTWLKKQTTFIWSYVLTLAPHIVLNMESQVIRTAVGLHFLKYIILYHTQLLYYL